VRARGHRKYLSAMERGDREAAVPLPGSDQVALGLLNEFLEKELA
jgi:hypothetical protein